jgi:hypothetical protein
LVILQPLSIMIKPHTLFLGFALFFYSSTLSFAQQNTDAAGGNATGTGGSVSYSIGQIDYISNSGTNGNVNQGVQQPYEIFNSGIEDASVQLGLSVYPNPSTQVLYLKIEQNDLKDLSYQLYDFNGKQLASKMIINNTTEIIMEQYATSTYFLKVFNSTKELTTFKIIKK